jgi:protease-4
MPWSRKKKTIVIIVCLIALIFCVSLIFGLVRRPSGNRIGVVEIEGLISASKDATEDIIRFKEDPSIKGVILRINSPGGSVGPTQEIYREVVKLKEKKKVYASMGSTCASGGYYIASAAEKLYANPSTITGSIGVIMQLMIVEDVLKKLGLKSDTIKAGEFKDTGTPFREMTPAEREYLNGIVQGIYEQFIKDVAAARKMNPQRVKELAEGRVYTGNQAKELGLIDDIGDFYDAVDGLKAALRIKGKPTLIYAEKPFSFSKWIFGALSKELVNELFSSPFKFVASP